MVNVLLHARYLSNFHERSGGRTRPFAPTCTDRGGLADRPTRRERHTGPIQEIRNRVEKCRMLSNWNGSYSLTSDSIGMLYPLDRWAERGALADRDAMCGANASDGIRREEGGVASIDVLWNFGAYKRFLLYGCCAGRIGSSQIRRTRSSSVLPARPCRRAPTQDDLPAVARPD